jgi:hypothetical protein
MYLEGLGFPTEAMKIVFGVVGRSFAETVQTSDRRTRGVDESAGIPETGSGAN